MSSQTQLEGVQQQIADVHQKISDLEASLVAAKQAEDGDEVSFLRDRLKHLDKKEVALREEKNLHLRAQQGGGHCSLLPPSAHSCYLHYTEHPSLGIVVTL